MFILYFTRFALPLSFEIKARRYFRSEKQIKTSSIWFFAHLTVPLLAET